MAPPKRVRMVAEGIGERCKGCNLCVQVCPTVALSLHDHAALRARHRSRASRKAIPAASESASVPEGALRGLPGLTARERSTSMPGTVSEELVDRAQRDGFVWEPGSVPLATIRALREVVLRVCDELGWLDPRAPLGDGVPKPGIGGFQTSDPAWVALQQQVLASPEFAAAGAAPGLRARVDALCDGAVLAGQGDLCRVVFPGDAPTPAHRDDSYTRLGRQGWTAWLPLGDCPAALGPLSVLPGSHLRDADGAAEAAWYVADLRAGDALLFSHRTLHRALPNRTARLRLSVEYRYRADPPVTTASAAG